MRVLGPNDEVIPARVNRYGGEGNTFMLTLERDLSYDTAYRVELSPELRTLEGSLTGVAQVIRFRTRCAPERLSDCPPIVAPLPTLRDPPVSDPRPRPDAGPPVVVMVDDAGNPEDASMARDAGAPVDAGAPATPTGCGCRAGSVSGAGGWACLAALGVLARRRRRRGQRQAT
ncbi:MAG: hypothetical protein KC656_35755, partial [Myxococcales bacterium]|nr:hypothetical protein [Myxococcales bacterium]